MVRIARFEKVSVQRFVADWVSTFPQQTVEQAVYAYERIKLPARATSGSAGYDFYAPVGFELPAGESIKIPTGHPGSHRGGMGAYAVSPQWLGLNTAFSWIIPSG